MNQSLMDAAQQGSIDALYSLIRSDAYVLDKVDAIPFANTPLHIAASSGRINFAMELMGLKPSFARKLNEDGYTPLHLALQNKQTQLVLRLIDADESLVRVSGREGLTPFHYVAQIGDLDFLTKFLKACPRSIEDVTRKKESALHIALKHDQVPALKILLGWLRRAWLKNATFWEKRLLNWQDEEGNTLLHIAVSENRPEIVRLLLKFKSHFRCKIYLNARNLGGHTVFDLLKGCTQHKDKTEIKNMLCGARLFRTLFHPRVPSLIDYFQSSVPIDEKLYIFLLRQRTNISNESRNVLLVVAVLLVAVTFQATVSPPGGVWQDEDGHPVGGSTMPIGTFLVMAALNLISFLATVFAIFVLLPGDLKSGLINLPLHLLSLYFIAAILVTAPFDVFSSQWLGTGVAFYLIFCFFSPVLFLLLRFLVTCRRRKLVNAFHPDMKLLDPTLT